MPTAIRRTRLPAPWQEQLLFADGRHMQLRPIEPADAEPLRIGFPLLTPDEIRMRFLHPLKELTPEMAHRLTHLDPRREFALVVAEPLPPGEALVGAVARASIDDASRCAEFALLVARLLSRQGLGRLLLRRLIFWARLKRLDEIYGDVLDENLAMLKLVESLGFQREHRPNEPGISRVRLALKR